MCAQTRSDKTDIGVEKKELIKLLRIKKETAIQAVVRRRAKCVKESEDRQAFNSGTCPLSRCNNSNPYKVVKCMWQVGHSGF